MKTLLILPIFCMLLASCVSSTPQDIRPRKSEVQNAMDTFYNCQIEYAPQIDDGYSDASTIALALTNRCIREYSTMIQIFGRYELDNDNARRYFSEYANTKDEKIEKSLPVVLRYRSGKL